MRALNIGDRVIIRAPKHRLPVRGLDAAFEGRTGIIAGREETMYRVRLDAPVTIPNIGDVSDDLWSRDYLKRKR